MNLGSFLYLVITIVLFGGVSLSLEHAGIRTCPFRGKNKTQQYALHVADGSLLFVGAILLLPLGVMGAVMITLGWLNISLFTKKAKITAWPHSRAS